MSDAVLAIGRVMAQEQAAAGVRNAHRLGEPLRLLLSPWSSLRGTPAGMLQEPHVRGRGWARTAGLAGSSSLDFMILE